jgi:hypothetical protein
MTFQATPQLRGELFLDNLWVGLFSMIVIISPMYGASTSSSIDLYLGILPYFEYPESDDCLATS